MRGLYAAAADATAAPAESGTRRSLVAALAIVTTAAIALGPLAAPPQGRLSQERSERAEVGGDVTNLNFGATPVDLGGRTSVTTTVAPGAP